LQPLRRVHADGRRSRSERHSRPEPENAAAGIVAGEALPRRGEGPGNLAKIRGAQCCVRVIEMRSVGEMDGVGPQLKPDPLGDLEWTGQAEVHVEVSWTAKRIATRVSVTQILGGSSKWVWFSECRRVEVVTSKVRCLTRGVRGRRLAPGQVEGTDEVRRLGRAIRGQSTPVPGYCEGQAGHHAEGRANLPAFENPAGHPSGRPALSLAERHIQHTINLDVVGTVESCGRVVLLPVRRIREEQEVQFFVV